MGCASIKRGNGHKGGLTGLEHPLATGVAHGGDGEARASRAYARRQDGARARTRRKFQDLRLACVKSEGIAIAGEGRRG